MQKDTNFSFGEDRSMLILDFFGAKSNPKPCAKSSNVIEMDKLEVQIQRQIKLNT